MTDQDRPQLNLGQPPGGLKNRTGPIPRRWLWALVALQTATLVCLAVLWRRPAAPGTSPGGTAAPADADELREVARQLEDRSLDAEAADAWRAYLEAEPQASDRAEILYRIGTLSMKAEQFDEAAAALVRSEVAAADNKELTDKIGPKLVECLRRLGRYGEVGRELSRRVEVGAKDTGTPKVLASLAGEELTEADLDRMIQRRVDQMLAMQGASDDEHAREGILRQLSTPQARQQMLQQLLQTELFCRRARELKLDQEEEYLRARQHLEEGLLANRFLSRQLEAIRPTDVDLESYYEANQERYREPESAEVRWIKLGADEDAAGLLAKIQSADDFRKLAAERQPSAASTGQAPSPWEIQRGRFDPLLGDVAGLFALSEGEWTKKPHANRSDKYLVLVEKRRPARTPPLAEVRERVRADYVAAKQREVSEKLFSDLMTRYQVRIMPPDEQKEEPGKPEKPEEGSRETDKEKKKAKAPQGDDATAQPKEEKTR